VTAEGDIDYGGLVDSLQSLPEDADLSARLTEAYTSLRDPRRAVQLLRRFLPLLETEEERYEILTRLAQLEEGLGEIEKAQLHYQAAAFAAGGPRRYEALLSSAELLIQQGAYRQAELQLNRVAEAVDAGTFETRARIGLIRCLLLNGDREAASRWIADFGPRSLPESPELLYQLIIATSELGETALMNTARKALFRLYPGSPESALLRGEVDSVPDVQAALGLIRTPHELLEEDQAITPPGTENGEAKAGSNGEEARTSAIEESEKTGEVEQQKESGTAAQDREIAEAIQTGSFRARDNAESMERELREQGFQTAIRTALVKNTTYYRVLVRIPEDSDTEEIILKLKEAGYEGYPVY
jgi:tetratricopeptide (TPR) repeat protein